MGRPVLRMASRSSLSCLARFLSLSLSLLLLLLALAALEAIVIANNGREWEARRQVATNELLWKLQSCKWLTVREADEIWVDVVLTRFG